MALGSLLIAIGLLTIPHDSSFSELCAKLMSGMAEGRRTMIGFGSIGLGLLSGLFGWILSLGRGATTAG